jgi:sigma-B regulation protein RsbU (phosphoserine phosphatase)
MEGYTAREVNLSKRLKNFVKANQSLAHIESLNDLLPHLQDLAQEVTGAEALSILLYNPESDVLEFALAKNEALGEETEQILKPNVKLKMGERLASWVAANHTVGIIRDVKRDKRFFKKADHYTGFQTRTLLCVHIVYGEELLGVIEVRNSKGRSCFDREDEEILDSFGQLAGVAILRSGLLETQLKQQKLQIANNFARHLLIQLFLCQTIPFLQRRVISHDGPPHGD